MKVNIENEYSGECPFCAEMITFFLKKAEIEEEFFERKCKKCGKPIEGQLVIYVSLEQGDS